jgi:hypothetical protein
LGSGKFVKCSEMKKSKIFELVRDRKLAPFKPSCLDFKGLKFNSSRTYGVFNNIESPATFSFKLRKCGKTNAVNLPKGQACASDREIENYIQKLDLKMYPFFI